jgi:hypothetical protein
LDGEIEAPVSSRRLRPSHQVARIKNVFLHGQSGLFRTSRPYRSVDFAVKHERLIHRDAIRKLAHTQKQRAMDTFE